jgi:predicted transcriptional regulator of viral defense system
MYASSATQRPRTLGPREAELVAWLEMEQPATVDIETVEVALGWPRPQARKILAQLAHKGWLQRATHGHYEPLLGDTGGIPLSSPWAALASWRVPHYVGFASAAYERGLTPDRPGAVQACVPVGTKRPKTWAETPITLVLRRRFSLTGTEEAKLHGFSVRIARPERIVLDSAAIPARAGGAFGLARIVDRGFETVDWSEIVTLANELPRGRAALRRLAAMLDLLGHDVPAVLARSATATSSDSPVYLGGVSVHGRRGPLLRRWSVIVNVAPAALRDEVRR